MTKKPVKIVEDLNEEVLPTEQTVELTIEEDTIVSDDEMDEDDDMEETEEDLDINSLEISMIKERIYDLEERVSVLEEMDEEESDDDSVI
jgi:hypothetical protein